MTSKKSGPQPVSRIIADALRRYGLDERMEERTALMRWREIVGDDIAAHSRAVDLCDGVLVDQLAGNQLVRDALTIDRLRLTMALLLYIVLEIAVADSRTVDGGNHGVCFGGDDRSGLEGSAKQGTHGQVTSNAHNSFLVIG